MPPPTAAIISQPLCRKNAACGLWSIVGIVSTFSALMKILFLAGLIKSFQTAKHTPFMKIITPGFGCF
jgi:hypothetical protein